MVKVTPPDAVEEVGEETEQNGQKEGRALEAVACGAHGQGGLLRVMEDFYLVTGFTGGGFIAQQVRGGDSVAGGGGELQHWCIAFFGLREKSQLNEGNARISRRVSAESPRSTRHEKGHQMPAGGLSCFRWYLFGWLIKQPQTGAGGGVVVSIQLATDGSAPARHSRCQRGAAASKRIHHQRIRHCVVYKVTQQRLGLLRGVDGAGWPAELHHIARASAAILTFAAGEQLAPIYRRFVFALPCVVRLAALAIQRHLVPHREPPVKNQHQFMRQQRHSVCVQHAHGVRFFPHPLVSKPPPLLADNLRGNRVLTEHQQYAVF